MKIILPSCVRIKGFNGMSQVFSRWWFRFFLNVHPYLGKWSNLTNMFQMGWNHPLSFHHRSFVSIRFLGGRMDVINDLPMGTPEANTAILSCAEWLNRLVSRQEMFFSMTWICLRWFFTFYRGKSPPSNHHFGEYLLLFPSILGKSKMSFGLVWLICLARIRHTCLNRRPLQSFFLDQKMVSLLNTPVFYRDLYIIVDSGNLSFPRDHWYLKKSTNTRLRTRVASPNPILTTLLVG